MICTRCGNNCPDGIAYCNHCGNPMQSAQQPVYQQPVYQQPYQPYQPPKPAYRPPVYKSLKLDLAAVLKKQSHIICAVIAVIALLVGILAGGGILYINAGMFGDLSNYGEEMVISYAASIYDTEDAALLYIGNILYGLVSLAIAAGGMFYLLKKMANNPLYDQTIGTLLKLEDPTFVLCGAGVLAGLLQAAIFLIAGLIESEGKGYCGPSWVTWLATAIYAIVGVANLVAQGKKD